MKNTFRALALATATAVGTSGIIVLPQTAMIATAQTNDAMPHKYYVEPAADAADYATEINTFLTVTRLRHVYHMAAAAWKYDNFPAPSQINDAHWRSEQQCWMGKARLALALMKSEGNADARKLDLVKVGVDAAETEAAFNVLKPEARKWAAAMINFDTDTPQRAEKESRKKIFNEGADALAQWLDAKKSDTPDFEFSAFQVIDWSIPKQYVDAQLANPEHGDLDDVLLGQKVLTVAHGTDYAEVKAAAEVAGAENQAYLAEKLGQLPNTGAEDPGKTDDTPVTTTAEQTSESSAAPTTEQTSEPSAAPTTEQTSEPSAAPTTKQTSEPSAAPTTKQTSEKQTSQAQTSEAQTSKPQTSEPKDSKQPSTSAATSEPTAKPQPKPSIFDGSQKNPLLTAVVAIIAVIGGVAATAFAFLPQLRQMFRF